MCPTFEISYIKYQYVQSPKNICRLFRILARFPFTTSERELDYYHQRLHVRVV